MAGGGAGRRPEGRRSRWSVAPGSPRSLLRGVGRMGWRNEEPICRWVTRRAGPPDAVISACKAPGRLGRQMLRLRLLYSPPVTTSPDRDQDVNDTRSPGWRCTVMSSTGIGVSHSAHQALTETEWPVVPWLSRVASLPVVQRSPHVRMAAKTVMRSRPFSVKTYSWRLEV